MISCLPGFGNLCPAVLLMSTAISPQMLHFVGTWPGAFVRTCALPR
jgi:hypothetical protein